jgi:hypothetical protein
MLLVAVWSILSMIPGCGRKEEQKQSSMASDPPLYCSFPRILHVLPDCDEESEKEVV